MVNADIQRASVCIVTTAYQSRPEHLQSALRSALRQTYSAIEIVVSDDSPTDALRPHVEALADVRLRYRHNSPALGVAQNHWRCFGETEAEFVVVLNHDDTLEPQFVERLIAPLQADSGLALAFCDHWIIDAEGTRDVPSTDAASRHYGRSALAPGRHQPFFHLLTAQTIPMAMGAMFRRASLPRCLPADAGPAYDLWLSYLLCRDGAGAYYLPERLSSWRSHAGNQTSVRGIALLAGTAHCWSAVARDYNAAAVRTAARAKEAAAYRSCSKWYCRNGQTKQTRQTAYRSLRAHASWRALALYAIGTLPAALGRRLV
jgi:glycosyltransferase involved in cell wall biosynthesis